MNFALTPSLHPDAEARAVHQLRRYYQRQPDGTLAFTGALFDDWDPSATRTAMTNTFTSDDLLAVSHLSVTVSSRAAYELLVRQRRRFEFLLTEVGPDRDLVDVGESIDQSWPAWRLSSALRELPGVGPTTAGKLLARKRPRLIPIYDEVINNHLLGGSGVQWVPLRVALEADDQALHQRLLAVRSAAGLGEHISALRILDVVAWMDGTHPLDD